MCLVCLAPQRIMEAVDVEDVCYEDLLLLLSHSSAEDINQSHKGGRAPMHVVCARGHLVALQLLLWVSCVRACVRVCVHLCVCVCVCTSVCVSAAWTRVCTW